MNTFHEWVQLHEAKVERQGSFDIDPKNPVFANLGVVKVLYQVMPVPSSLAPDASVALKFIGLTADNQQVDSRPIASELVFDTKGQIVARFPEQTGSSARLLQDLYAKALQPILGYDRRFAGLFIGEKGISRSPISGLYRGDM